MKTNNREMEKTKVAEKKNDEEDSEENVPLSELKKKNEIKK